MARQRAVRGRGASRSRKGRGPAAGVVGAGTPPAVDAAAALVCHEHRRFPWPRGAETRRYGLATPYLAVVNARGPWACWRHPGAASPPFIPLYLGLLDKGFWRSATNDQRVFWLTIVLNAAREDRNGVVWGDPVRLCYDCGLDVATFDARLAWMIGVGQAVYLSREEAEAVKTSRSSKRERGGEKPEGGGGESGKGGEREQAEQDKARQAEQGKQISDPPSARATQVSRLGTSAGETTARQAEQASQAKSQQPNATAQQGQEPANLPKSDHGAATEPQRATGHARGLPARPPSASVSLGEAIAWTDARAVLFGRSMFAAIHGRAAPPDLQAATESDRADVGVWVHFWRHTVAGSIPAGRYDAFEKRCVRDIGKKRKVRRIRNLGAVAMAKIVPGIVAAMQDK